MPSTIPKKNWYMLKRPSRPHHREMDVTAKAEVSWLTPTNTEPRLAWGS
jgi:hypothetical protein